LSCAVPLRKHKFPSPHQNPATKLYNPRSHSNSEELCNLKSHSNSEELSQQQQQEEETTTPTPEEILLLLQEQPRFKLQNEDCEECRGKYL